MDRIWKHSVNILKISGIKRNFFLSYVFLLQLKNKKKSQIFLTRKQKFLIKRNQKLSARGKDFSLAFVVATSNQNKAKKIISSYNITCASCLSSETPSSASGRWVGNWSGLSWHGEVSRQMIWVELARLRLIRSRVFSLRCDFRLPIHGIGDIWSMDT